MLEWSWISGKSILNHHFDDLTSGELFILLENAASKENRSVFHFQPFFGFKRKHHDNFIFNFPFDVNFLAKLQVDCKMNFCVKICTGRIFVLFRAWVECLAFIALEVARRWSLSDCLKRFFFKQFPRIREFLFFYIAIFQFLPKTQLSI